MLGSKCFEIACVGFVGYIRHAHVECFEFDMWLVDAGTFGHELQQGERILPAGQTDQNTVAFSKQAVLFDSFTEMAPDALFENLFGSRLHGLLHKDEIDGQNQTTEGGQMIPVQTLSLKHQVGDDCKYDERDDFLNHLELHQ